MPIIIGILHLFWIWNSKFVTFTFVGCEKASAVSGNEAANNDGNGLGTEYCIDGVKRCADRSTSNDRGGVADGE